MFGVIKVVVGDKETKVDGKSGEMDKKPQTAALTSSHTNNVIEELADSVQTHLNVSNDVKHSAVDSSSHSHL